ncbi:F-box protein [Aquicella lusitana]|uniref:F-box associated protein n=1 Tax=Aquicella lusitana TaxID=254246 RepID=A0A370G1C0_9COXI|nr:F-box protein [Aquicella lusitana]RDI37568.1 F-box associated protein [Aquicella lusitana]VVC74694.1 hypothetical protein AQULUS_24600 [Aquicella lusitana]
MFSFFNLFNDSEKSKDQNDINYLELMPKEILSEIIRYLTPSELLQLSAMSKYFYRNVNQPDMWAHFFKLSSLDKNSDMQKIKKLALKQVSDLFTLPGNNYSNLLAQKKLSISQLLAMLMPYGVTSESKYNFVKLKGTYINYDIGSQWALNPQYALNHIPTTSLTNFFSHDFNFQIDAIPNFIINFSDCKKLNFKDQSKYNSISGTHYILISVNNISDLVNFYQQVKENNIDTLSPIILVHSPSATNVFDEKFLNEMNKLCLPIAATINGGFNPLKFFWTTFSDRKQNNIWYNNILCKPSEGENELGKCLAIIANIKRSSEVLAVIKNKFTSNESNLTGNQVCRII